MKRVPTDFFVDELSKDNFLKPALEVLVLKLEEAPATLGDSQQAFISRGRKLRRFVYERFGFEVRALTPRDDQAQSDVTLLL